MGLLRREVRLIVIACAREDALARRPADWLARSAMDGPAPWSDYGEVY